MILEEEIKSFINNRNQMKKSKMDIMNKILNILKNFDNDIDNSNLLELNSFLINNKVFDKLDMESWRFARFNNRVNEIRRKIMNKDNEEEHTCGHCLHCDMVGHCSAGTYAFTRPEWLKKCAKLEVGTHEQLNGRNMYYTGDLQK